MSRELDDTISADALDGAVTPLPVDLGEGALVADRYLVEARIGEGGMGAVYRVRDRVLDEPVALKLLTLVTPRALERFLAEVKLARRVTHPNVARTHDLGSHAGVHFLTMELIRGPSLDDLLEREGGRLGAERAIAIGADIAKGLSAAHAAGVVHRDLKPANVLMTEDGRAVITDFGIARAAEGEAARKETGGLVGTPAYMAPEQVRGGPLDARADVYALGLILYELVTGVLPFEGPTAIALALARLQAAPVDPRRHADVPDPLANLILRCLAREPEGRPSSAAEVRAALEGLGAPSALTQRALTAPTRSGLFAPLAPSVRSLAILPFAYRGPEEHDYLGEGLAEELVDVLSQTKGLKVLSLGATRRFAEERDPTRMAQELGVQEVVDGTVQRAGDRVRLTARLLDAHEGVQRWTERFDGTYDDVFVLQEKLARRVAEALRLELGASASSEQAPPEAVELYLRARRHLRSGILTGSESAVEMLDRALALAPHVHVFKAAHAVACVRAWWGDVRDDDNLRGQRARDSVARALEEAPDLAETHFAEAILVTQDGDYHRAAQALRRALEIAPTLAEAHSYLGGLQAEALPGREGIERLRSALELDPSLHICHLGLARASLLRGDMASFAHHEAALAEAFPPQHLPTLVSRFRWALYRGDAADARAHLETLRTLDTEAGERMARLCAPAIGEGSIEAARETYETMRTWLPNGRFMSLMMQIATEVFCVAGETELALEALTRAARGTLIDLVWIRSVELLAPLRGTPELAEVEATVAARAAAIWRR